MNPQLKESLRSYGGPLSREQVETLRDIQGWIEYCISNGLTLKSALGVIAHDANGLLADVPYFEPKVRGYSKYLTEVEDLSGLARDPDLNAD